MWQLFNESFRTAGLIPHGFCLQWNPKLLWTLVAADSIIAASYFSIPFAIWYFAKKRPDIQFRWLFLLFGLFIISCGITHLLDVLVIWEPNYWANAIAKTLTAALSLGTGVALWLLMPSALSAPSEQVLKNALNEIEAAAQYSRSLLEASLDPLVTISAEGKITDVNAATEQVTGCSREALIGSDFCNYFTEPEQARQGYQEVYDKGFVTDYPLAIRHRDGRITDVLYNASVYRNQAGEIEGIFAAARDVTEIKRAEEQLRQKDELMIRQSRLAAMGEMVGNIAHQWRQPLNALGLVLGNIKDAQRYHELTPEYLESQEREAWIYIDKMSNTINDFRNFFRPDKHSVPFSLNQAIGIATALVETSFKTHGIEITVDVQHDITINGFANEYSQVLLNLLTNAKEAILAHDVSPGLIKIRLIREDGTCRVTVADNGGGISVEVLPRLFEPYFSTKECGSGIGLYMSKMIIEKSMGGYIGARNIANGAEFSIVTSFVDTNTTKNLMSGTDPA